MPVTVHVPFHIGEETTVMTILCKYKPEQKRGRRGRGKGRGEEKERGEGGRELLEGGKMLVARKLTCHCRQNVQRTAQGWVAVTTLVKQHVAVPSVD